MRFDTIAAFAASRPNLPAGVVGIVFCDAPLHSAATARRLADQGVGTILAVGDMEDVEPLACPLIRIAEAPRDPGTYTQLNALIDVLKGRWMLWLWNGEFFFFPFGETRSVADLVAFMSDERRRSVYTYGLDLYADALPGPGDPVADFELWFDREGYHAFPDNKQLQLFGGLGWRYQEFVPKHLLQIGRASLFRAEAGVHLLEDMTFENTDYAAISCPWHNNPTAAVMTLRRTRRVLTHPNFKARRDRLFWHGSEKFSWNSAQLLELGMIEPGQWF